MYGIWETNGHSRLTFLVFDLGCLRGHPSRYTAAVVQFYREYALDQSYALVEEGESNTLVRPLTPVSKSMPQTRVLFIGADNTSLIGAIVVRLNFTPSDIFQAGFTIDSVNLLIIMIVEMHFHIINATYPNLLVFAEKATTGFIIHGAPRTVSITAIPSSNASSDGQDRRSYSLSQRFKFLSSRHPPEKSQSHSVSSETGSRSPQDSGNAYG